MSNDETVHRLACKELLSLGDAVIIKTIHNIAIGLVMMKSLGVIDWDWKFVLMPLWFSVNWINFFMTGAVLLANFLRFSWKSITK